MSGPVVPETPGGPPAAVLGARARAEEIVSAEAVQFAIDQMAVRLTVALNDANPVLLCVLHGGLNYTGELLKRLAFPLELSYVHVGRYGHATSGQTLNWFAKPAIELAGRHVLLIDDIFDQGKTLSALVDWSMAEGAARVTTTVLVDKLLDGGRDGAISIDYPALRCPDRYLFGCGMDFRGYWRNLPAIYALPGDMEDRHD
jgi:hypoxanthine phosphoribosyltransferase